MDRKEHYKPLEIPKIDLEQDYRSTDYLKVIEDPLYRILADYIYSFERTNNDMPDYSLQITRELEKNLGISATNEVADPKLQEKKPKTFWQTIYDSLRLKMTRSELRVSDAVSTTPQFQEAVRKTILIVLSCYIDELDKLNEGHSDEYLQIAHKLQQKFGVSAGEIEIDPEWQEKVRKKMLSQLQRGHFDTFRRIKATFFVSDDVYAQPEFQEVVKKGLALEIEDYLISGGDEKLQDILDAIQNFQLGKESLEEMLRSVTMISLKLGGINTISRIQKLDFLPTDFFMETEIGNMIMQILSRSLSQGEIKSLEIIIQEPGFLNNIYSAIDHKASEELKLNLNKPNSILYLIRFIEILGNDRFYEKFPQTLELARKAIFEKLDSNPSIAELFFTNLDKYYQQDWVVEYIFRAVKHYSVAVKFDKCCHKQPVWKNEPWVAIVLDLANKTIVRQILKDSQQKRERNEGKIGFSDSDPYEKHPWLFTGQQIKITSVLSDFLNDKADETRLEQLGIRSSEVVPLLKVVKEKIDKAYEAFIEQIRSNSNMQEEDKLSLLNPESNSEGMIPFKNIVRAFVARYLVQCVGGDVTKLSNIEDIIINLNKILAIGFRKYIKVHERDIPLYDKLYEEFDNLRKENRYPLEVYLGGDGVYAWIGRRAQDVARRRKMGWEDRRAHKEMGRVIAIHPQYTVYPTFFRKLAPDTKLQYLKQQGISIDTDPIFFDSGFIGSIPESIMKLMGFEPDEIERRIRLLFTLQNNRRVKGIPIISTRDFSEIENNSKPEETAEGLIKTKNQRIRHIAKPTDPEEQFYFNMIKQAITRHYWLQENAKL